MTSASDNSITDLPLVADLSYEQARDELVALVARIESGQVPLEEAMDLWGRGEELAAHCQAKLDAAQERLDHAIDRAAATRGADQQEAVTSSDDAPGPDPVASADPAPGADPGPGADADAEGSAVD